MARVTDRRAARRAAERGEAMGAAERAREARATDARVCAERRRRAVARARRVERAPGGGRRARRDLVTPACGTSAGACSPCWGATCRAPAGAPRWVNVRSRGDPDEDGPMTSPRAGDRSAAAAARLHRCAGPRRPLERPASNGVHGRVPLVRHRRLLLGHLRVQHAGRDVSERLAGPFQQFVRVRHRPRPPGRGGPRTPAAVPG